MIEKGKDALYKTKEFQQLPQLEAGTNQASPGR